MGRPIHFEMNADDPEELSTFYDEVFNWKTNKWDANDEAQDYWLITTGRKKDPGIDGAFMKIDSPQKTRLIIDVDSVDETAKKVKKNGGEVVTEKMPVPGVGWVIYFNDPEGNFVGAIENDPDAK